MLPTRLASGGLFRVYAASFTPSVIRQGSLGSLVNSRIGLVAAVHNSSRQRPKRLPILQQVQWKAAFQPIRSLQSTRLQSTISLSHIPESSIPAPSPEVVAEEEAPTVTRRIVAYHLFICAAMVYLIIIVGGLTRLTESGLSITEWNPGFKGMKLPWTNAEWDAEWEKYKRTPEWSM
jgi:cytochrome c oxidase assembly protein subunit 15